MICDSKEQEARSPQIDLTLPNCDDYAALGYKVLPIKVLLQGVANIDFSKILKSKHCMLPVCGLLGVLH